MHSSAIEPVLTQTPVSFTQTIINFVFVFYSMAIPYAAADEIISTDGNSPLRMDNEIAEFSSNLPVIVINTNGQTLFNDDSYVTATTMVFNDPEARTRIDGAAEYSSNSGLKIRGSSSAEFPKKQYRLEMRDVQDDDLNVDLLGMGADSDWVLYAPGRFDRSMIANPLMYGLADSLGLPGMETRFVELFLNDDDDELTMQDYDGLYVLTEAIKIDKQRIDIEKLEPTDEFEPALSGGYLLARDRPDEDEFWFRTPRMGPLFAMVVNRPKLDDITEAQKRYIEDYFLAFEEILYGPDPQNPTTGYTAYIEQESWIIAHMLSLLSHDVDMLRVSNYFYKDRQARLMNAPVWDFDRSLNSDSRWDDNPLITHAPVSEDPFAFSWWGKLFELPAFDERYRQRWHEARRGPLSLDNLNIRIDRLTATIQEAWVREDVRWGATEGYGSRYSDLNGEIAALKDWMARRLEFLDSLLPEPAAVQSCTGSILSAELPKDTWRLLSLPCEPPSGYTVQMLFGDDLVGIYGEDWIIFTFDATSGDNGNYTDPTADGTLSPGQGFWIIQSLHANSLLTLPSESILQPRISAHSHCQSPQGCQVIRLSSPNRWHLIGNPFAQRTPLRQWQFSKQQGVCADTNGCSFSEATDMTQQPLVHRVLYGYNGRSSGYDAFEETQLADVWDGLWIRDVQEEGTVTPISIHLTTE